MDKNRYARLPCSTAVVVHGAHPRHGTFNARSYSKIFSFLYSLLFWYLGYKLQVSNPWELKRSGWLGSRLAIKFT